MRKGRARGAWFELDPGPHCSLMAGMETKPATAMRKARRCNEAMAATVIGYCRVSSADQATSGISLDAQRHRLEAYCAAHGLTLARVEEDAGISARKTTNRPAHAFTLTVLLT